MKLKSKLIATIVSICAAIAVMGVGVWAATDDFTVTVTNEVNIEIANLSGTVKATATATKVGGDAFTAAEFKDVVIFDSKGAAGVQDATGTISKDGEHSWNGAELFTNIDDATTSAVLTYTFVYTPYGTPKGVTNVAITPTTLPQDADTNVMSYTYQINGGEAKKFDAAVTVYDAATEAITITVTATYTNADLVSTIVTGNYAFTVQFATAQAGVGTEI